MILASRPPGQEFPSHAVGPIPPSWDGRLLRVGDGAPAIGGAATHVHGFVHRHPADPKSPIVSGPSQTNDKPLGLVNVGASGGHTHLVATQSQSPGVTGPASNIPPSRTLLAFLMTESLWQVRPGIIVGYVGRDVPAGWQLCDGRNGTPRLDRVYIMIKRSGAVGGLVGQATHHHDATHTHAWGIGQADPHQGFAFYGDKFPAPHTDFAVSPLNHTHSVIETHPVATQTDDVQASPPSITVTFIQAGPQARDMPKGAIMPYSGAIVPLGWSQWQADPGADLGNRFLFASRILSAPRPFGTSSHVHKVRARHDLTLEAPLAPGAAVERQSGPAVAVAAHTHAVHVDETVTTAPASHIPPFVSMHFIEKD